MKKILSAFLILCAFKAMADSMAPAHPYELTSLNNKYILKSVPFEQFGALGESYVLNVTTHDTLYTVDQYLWQPALIDNTGEYIVSIKSWPGIDPLRDITAIAFFRNGKEYKSVKLGGITSDSAKFSYSVSHILWYKNSEINGSEFSILLADGGLHTFDLKTGALIKSRLIEDAEEKLSFIKLAITYDDSIRYPNRQEFPALVSSDNFYDAFNRTMPFRIYGYGYPRNDSVKTRSCYGVLTIDKSGNGLFSVLETSIRRVNSEGVEQVVLKPEQEKLLAIAEFVKKQKFDTSKIPKGIPKWAFSTWIYVEHKK